MKSILFVCLGNICRSPLAEGLFRQKTEAEGIRMHIDSAGTGNWHIGEPPCEHSIRVASRHGIAIGHLRARQVEAEDFQRFDYIVGLDSSNVADLEVLGAPNVLKLGDYGFEGKDVPDPYFFPGFEGFENVYNMIDICTSMLLAEILNHRA